MAVTWEELAARVKACRGCALAATCTQKVFGMGDHEARVVIVGEAPRAEDDLYGTPFHDGIGLFLRKQMANAGFVKGDVFLCTLMKCRPPKGREPYAKEIQACLGHLMDQVDLVKPVLRAGQKKIVVALGQVAFKALVPKAKVKVGTARGDPHSVQDFIVVPTWNPAYVVASKSYLRVKEFQKDLRRVRERAFPKTDESFASKML